jgi:peptide deformylase
MILTLEQLPKFILFSKEFPSLVDIQNNKLIHLLYEKLQDESSNVECLGLAAIQIGYKYHAFYIKETKTLYLNCKYCNYGQFTYPIKEGCLSIPNKTFLVHRAPIIYVNGYIYQNNKIDELQYTIFYSPLSYIFQHEIDHCNLITINQIGQEINANTSK